MKSRKKDHHYIYMAVTNCPYEWPLAVFENQAEAASWVGVGKSAISRGLREGRRHSQKFNIVRIDLREEEEEL